LAGSAVRSRNGSSNSQLTSDLVSSTVMPALTYVRFVVTTQDSDSGRRQGLFQAAAALAAAQGMHAHEIAEYEELKRWFNANLETPERLAVSPRRHSKAQALSWFKSTATEHIAHMRSLARLLESHGVTTEMIRSSRPGYVLYEDDYQVAAYPFAETTT
jgi:hypothetical protein